MKPKPREFPVSGSRIICNEKFLTLKSKSQGHSFPKRNDDEWYFTIALVTGDR